MIDSLASLPLFHSLDSESLKQLANMIRTKELTAGNILFYEGDHPSDLIILASGRIKLFKSGRNAKQIVLHHTEAVSLVAEVPLLHQTPYPATAECESACTFYLIPYSEFEQHFLNNPKLSRLLILSLSKKIRVLEGVIERTLVLDASERVLQLITQTPELFEQLRHYELAQRLNLTPETLSRTLKKLQEEGKIVKNSALWAVTPLQI